MHKVDAHHQKHLSLSKVLYSIFTIFTANLLILSPTYAATKNLNTPLSDNIIKLYGENDIIFYEAGVCSANSSSSIGVTLNVNANEAFNDNALQIMATLKLAGYSDTSVAAILGNLKGESGSFNPGEIENAYGDDLEVGSNQRIQNNSCYGRCGIGIAQWTSQGRQDNLQSFADQLGQPYTTLAVQAEFLIAELSHSQYRYNITPDSLNSMDIESATYRIYRHYEIPGSALKATENRQNGNVDNAPSSLSDLQANTSSYPAAWSAYTGRLAYARAALELLAGSSIVNSTNSTYTGNGSDVTIIGDSITNRSRSAILAALPGLSDEDIHAQDSKQFYTGSDSNPGGYDILRSLISSNELKNTLIFALGTNSTALQKSQVEAVVNAVHDYNPSGIIVFVTNYYYKDVDHYYNNNLWLSTVASENSNFVKVADWAAAANQDPNKYIDLDDGYNVHPTRGDGTDLFAKTITQYITTGVAGTMSSDITNCTGIGSSYANNNGVTELNINSHTYAFPLAYATKDNYLRNSNSNLTSRYGSTASVLSQPTSWYHHDYPALDMGIWMEAVDGHTRTPNDSGSHWGGDSSINSELYYLSSGATVVSITSGTITWVKKSYEASGVPASWQNKCGSLSLRGDDGNSYYMTHISADSILVSEGQQVSVGQPLAEVGAPYCAQSTQAHLHIDMNGSNDNSGNRTSDDTLKTIISQLYDALPATRAELLSRDSGSSLSDSQAQKIASYYKSDSVTALDWDLPSSQGKWNCVSLVAWFAQYFTNIGHVQRSWGNGRDTAHSLATTYNLTEGNAPQPYSVFSVTQGNLRDDDGVPYGHTGIVVAVNGNQVTTIEASYGDVGYTGVEHRDISYFTNSAHGYTFTYLEPIMVQSILTNLLGS